MELDFVYMPSRDPAADCDFFTDVLGARLEFRIEAFGARVAMVAPSDAPPRVLFADHLRGERPVLVYRVESLAAIEPRGETFGIPHGPCCMLDVPGGQRVAAYELTRPRADERLRGRRDF